MILSDYDDTKYYIPENFEIGSIGIVSENGELKPIKIVSLISFSKDSTAYNFYCGLSQEERNEFTDSDLSCEFVAVRGTSWIVGFDLLTEDNIEVSHYC